MRPRRYMPLGCGGGGYFLRPIAIRGGMRGVRARRRSYVRCIGVLIVADALGFWELVPIERGHEKPDVYF